MSLVESSYRSLWAKKKPMERMARTSFLFEETCEILENRIATEFDKLDTRQMRLKIAQKLYLTDPHAQFLLEKVSAT